eukprot:TRINITY_DN3263_c0_g1_i2.p1 TRINITY_DN3263_c0_g1~~TRINITY_DN3263_c0_g1_i2.p1  ORF type:complete len:472 (-),score=109.15 TRINITY_DN3263_c0_g1_i2:53-1444(-)
MSETDSENSPGREIVRIPIKQLKKLMVEGENDLVTSYLKKLPSDEKKRVSRNLIRSLTEYQKKKSNTVKSRDRKSRRRITSNYGSGSSSIQLTRKRESKSDDHASLRRSFRDIHQHYDFGKSLGKGAFGTVYLATHRITGEKYAIKQMDKGKVGNDKLPKVMRESQILDQLDHVNIVKIFDVYDSKDDLYFVLEYIDCGTLFNLLKKNGLIPEDLIARYIRQVLEGLVYLHDQGIVHRDIKGDNILLTSDGTVKITDFGTAKPEDAGTHFTVIGTPYWMAPEIIDMTGGGKISDIWSLGCTVVELLTGKPPYYDLTTMQALFNIVQDDVPPIPDNISHNLEHFLKNCCFVKDIEKRPSAEMLLGHPWIQSADSTQLTFEQAVARVREYNKDSSVEIHMGSKKKKSVPIIEEAEEMLGQSRQDIIEKLKSVTLERDNLVKANEELAEKLQLALKENQRLKQAGG